MKLLFLKDKYAKTVVFRELSGYQWVDKESLEKILVETVSDKSYETLVTTLERLAALPYAYRSKDFIMKYRKALMSQERTYLAPEPQYDADGRAFITTYGKFFIVNLFLKMYFL